jgi:hypothetical protein
MFAKKINLRIGNIQRNESHANGREMIFDSAKTTAEGLYRSAMK